MTMRRPNGFTLIEVLVALTIVAITLGAGVKAAGALTDNTQRLADVSAAQWCADNHLTGLRLLGLKPPVGDTEFTCIQLSQTYRGRLTVRPTPNPLFVNVEALVADDAAWSTSALALALDTSQHTVQRALVKLEAAQRVRSIGRARAQRWLSPPLAGFTTILLLPTSLPAG